MQNHSKILSLSELGNLKMNLEEYNDGTTHLIVDTNYHNNYLVIKIVSSGLDNYNWELFHSILKKIIQADQFKIAFDMTEVKFIAENFFNSVLISFSKFLYSIGGELVLAGWNGMPKEFISLLEYDKAYYLPTDFDEAVTESKHINYKCKFINKSEILEMDQEIISDWILNAEKIYNKILPWRDDPWKGNRI